MSKKSFNVWARLLGKDEASGPLLKGLGKIRVAARGLGSSIKQGVGIGLGMAGLNSILDTAKNALHSVTTGYAEAMDETVAFANAQRMSVAALQTWEYVAKRSDVSTEALRGSFQGLNITLGQIRIGAGKAYKFLSSQKSLAPLVKQLKGAKDANDALGISLGFLGRVKNQGERNLLATKLGLTPEMLRIVDQGAEGIARLQKEAAKWGLTSDKAAGDIDAYNDANDRLTASLDGLKRTIGEHLMPVLTPYVDKLADWVANHRKLIGQKVGEWVDKGAKAIPKLVDAFDKALPVLNAVGDSLARIGSLIRVLEGRLPKSDFKSPEAAQFYTENLGSYTQDEINRAGATVKRQHRTDLNKNRTPEQMPNKDLTVGSTDWWKAVKDEAEKLRLQRPANTTGMSLTEILRQQSVDVNVRVEAATGTGAEVTKVTGDGPGKVRADVGVSGAWGGSW